MCLSKLRHSLDLVAGFMVQRITPIEIACFQVGGLTNPVICSYNEDICYPEKEDRESTILYMYIYTIIYTYIYYTIIYI